MNSGKRGSDSKYRRQAASWSSYSPLVSEASEYFLRTENIAGVKVNVMNVAVFKGTENIYIGHEIPSLDA